MICIAQLRQVAGIWRTWTLESRPSEKRSPVRGTSPDDAAQHLRPAAQRSKARRGGGVHCDVPLDLSAPRYKDRPLLGFLDAYALAVIGHLSAEDEPIVAAAVNRAFGNTDDW